MRAKELPGVIFRDIASSGEGHDMSVLVNDSWWHVLFPIEEQAVVGLNEIKYFGAPCSILKVWNVFLEEGFMPKEFYQLVTVNESLQVLGSPFQKKKWKKRRGYLLYEGVKVIYNHVIQNILVERPFTHFMHSIVEVVMDLVGHVERREYFQSYYNPTGDFSHPPPDCEEIFEQDYV